MLKKMPKVDIDYLPYTFLIGAGIGLFATGMNHTVDDSCNETKIELLDMAMDLNELNARATSSFKTGEVPKKDTQTCEELKQAQADFIVENTTALKTCDFDLSERVDTSYGAWAYSKYCF